MKRPFKDFRPFGPFVDSDEDISEATTQGVTGDMSKLPEDSTIEPPTELGRIDSPSTR